MFASSLSFMQWFSRPCCQYEADRTELVQKRRSIADKWETSGSVMANLTAIVALYKSYDPTLPTRIDTAKNILPELVALRANDGLIHLVKNVVKGLPAYLEPRRVVGSPRKVMSPKKKRRQLGLRARSSLMLRKLG